MYNLVDRKPKYNKIPYSPCMREVIKFSKNEAIRLYHDYIGPEHYLLGMIRKGNGIGVETLLNLHINLSDLKIALEQMLQIPNGPVPLYYPPNKDALRVLEMAEEIAHQMKFPWVGSEHLLLGLIKQNDTVASRCLHNFGLEFYKVQKEALNILDRKANVEQMQD